jgi:hypothetical protein
MDVYQNMSFGLKIRKVDTGEGETFFVTEVALAKWKEGGKVFNRALKAGNAFYTPGDLGNNVTNAGVTPLKAVFAVVKAKGCCG